MTNFSIWIIESKHKNPNNFYVKVDGSPSYTGFWVANTKSVTAANELVMEACSELDLGEVDIVSTIQSTELSGVVPKEVKEKIDRLIDQAKNHEDVHLAAWVSSNGGLW